ncbi:hypothetical protein SEUCBS139899_006945 [Sporothrix eucalyptigena]|uniref:Dihydrodipicolinate synthetase family protein n=1 Tax=Sporothrix eucalyptigena TaxID=1812306 RepID=A0ABP0C3V6_9PEZI
MPPPRVPPQGVWAPAVTFFDRATDEVDLDAQAKYFAYLASTGLAGLVVLGTNAETFLLTREERKAILETARRATGPDFPIMAGVGGHSTKQVLEYIGDAAAAGANYALLLPPAYFGAKLTTPAVVDAFYGDIATASPLPIVIYNLPLVCNGVDLDSATIARLAKANSNIVGVKLTCGSVAKITRLSAEFPVEEFIAFGGQADFLVGALASGAGGTIAGFANVLPKTIVQIYNLYKQGQHDEALAVHRKAALAEQPCKAGVAAVKYAAAHTTARLAGIDGALEKLLPRRPYTGPSLADKAAIDEHISPLLSYEASL